MSSTKFPPLTSISMSSSKIHLPINNYISQNAATLKLSTTSWNISNYLQSQFLRLKEGDSKRREIANHHFRKSRWYRILEREKWRAIPCVRLRSSKSHVMSDSLSRFLSPTSTRTSQGRFLQESQGQIDERLIPWHVQRDTKDRNPSGDVQSPRYSSSL